MTAILHYSDGRGLAAGIRIALCAAKIPFTEVTYTKREQFVELLQSNKLQFNQYPLLEIDGMNLVQTRAIVRYIGTKAGFCGDNDKMAARIDVLYEGAKDFFSPFIKMVFVNEKDVCNQITSTTFPRYLPIFNKVLQDNGTGYLVGDKLSIADLQLYEVLLATVDYFEKEALKDYTYLKDFLEMMNSKEEMKLYLNKYRKRKNDQRVVKEVEQVLDMVVKL